eukprot:36180_1
MGNRHSQKTNTDKKARKVSKKVKQDKNNITVTKIAETLKQSGFDDDLIKQLINTLKKNKDGMISREQFKECFGYWKLVKLYNDVLDKQNQCEDKEKQSFIKRDYTPHTSSSSLSPVRNFVSKMNLESLESTSYSSHKSCKEKADTGEKAKPSFIRRYG